MDHILDLASRYGLPVLWLGLFVAGLGVPIPEDIFLITGGVLTHRAQSSVVFALVVLYSGVLVGDAIVYRLGSRYGEAVLRRPFIARLMTPARIERVRRYYARYGALTVFLCRHVAGIRFPAFLMAGVSRIGFVRFMFWDGLSALLSVPLWFLLGYKASEHWKTIHKQVTGWVAVVVAVIVALVLAWHFRHPLARMFGRKKPEVAPDRVPSTKDPTHP